MSELNYASALAALDDDFASASAHPRRIFTEKLTSGYCSICLSNVSTLSGWGSMPDPHCRFANIGKGQPRLMSISR